MKNIFKYIFISSLFLFLFIFLVLYPKKIYAALIIDGGGGSSCLCGYVEKTCYRTYRTTCSARVCDYNEFGRRICQIETWTCTKTKSYDCDYCSPCSNQNPKCPTSAFISSCKNSGCTGAVCGKCTGCPEEGAPKTSNPRCKGYSANCGDNETAVYDNSVHSCICIDIVDTSGTNCDCSSVSTCQAKLSSKSCTYPKHAGIVSVKTGCYMLTCVDGSSATVNPGGGDDPEDPDEPEVCLDIPCDPTEYCDDNGWTTTPTDYLLEDVVKCTALENCLEVTKYGDCYEDGGDNPPQSDNQTLQLGIGSKKSHTIEQKRKGSFLNDIKSVFNTVTMLLY